MTSNAVLYSQGSVFKISTDINHSSKIFLLKARYSLLCWTCH